MFLVILCILFTVGYTFLLNLINCSKWFNFLFVPVSFIVAIITVLLLLVTTVYLLPKKHPNGKFRHFLSHQAVWLTIKLTNYHIKVIGYENLPKDPYVLCSNHKSMMDPVICYYVCKKSKMSFVAKKELFQIGILAMLKKRYGIIAIDRENDREAVKSIIEAIKLIKNGTTMVVYPEGGIKSRDTDLMVDLKAGAYKLVTKSQVPLVPVSVIGSSKITDKGVFERKDIVFIIHKPIMPTEYKPLNTEKIGEMVFDIVNGGINQYEEKKSS